MYRSNKSNQNNRSLIDQTPQSLIDKSSISQTHQSISVRKLIDW